MSMLDDLEALPVGGKKCFFQKILREEGQEVYDEMAEVLNANASNARKHRVFINRGYHVGLSTVSIHGKGECAQCR